MVDETVVDRDAAIPDPRAVARTYDPSNYSDPWDLVTDYYHVKQEAARRPELGTAALATELDMPRGRIRPWLKDDVTPDPVRALQTAQARDWFLEEDDLETSRGTGLAILVTWVIAGGSINRMFVPYLVCDGEDRHRSLGRLYHAGQSLGIVFRRNDRSDARADEYVPSRDPSALGRVLHAVGAPVGAKTEQRLALPDWIVSGPANVTGAAAATYIAERMTRSGNARVYQHRAETRSDTFLEQIGGLLTEVLGGAYTVRNDYLRLDTTASRNADQLLEL